MSKNGPGLDTNVSRSSVAGLSILSEEQRTLYQASQIGAMQRQVPIGSRPLVPPMGSYTSSTGMGSRQLATEEAISWRSKPVTKQSVQIKGVDSSVEGFTSQYDPESESKALNMEPVSTREIIAGFWGWTPSGFRLFISKAQSETEKDTGDTQVLPSLPQSLIVSTARPTNTNPSNIDFATRQKLERGGMDTRNVIKDLYRS